jgi:Tfp pilus assembly protein PilO
MTLLTPQSYRMLRWLMPVAVLFIARDFLWMQCENVYDHIVNIKAAAERIRKTGADVRELPEMKNDYEQLVRKKTKISSSMFGAESQTGLYDLLMQKAEDSKVSIVAVSPRQQKADAGFIELPLSIEVAGGFDDIALFVNAIEKVNRLMRVEEISFSKDQTGRLSAGIKVLAFLYSDTLGQAGGAKGKKEPAYQKRENYLADLRKALDVQIAPATFAYTPGEHGDPFGVVMTEGAKPATGAPPVVSNQQIGLTLKGILWKNPPLAILETLDGKTYPVQEGETVNGCKVVAIERSEVKIATPRGIHVLHQYDEK